MNEHMVNLLRFLIIQIDNLFHVSIFFNVFMFHYGLKGLFQFT